MFEYRKNDFAIHQYGQATNSMKIDEGIVQGFLGKCMSQSQTHHYIVCRPRKAGETIIQSENVAF